MTKNPKTLAEILRFALDNEANLCSADLSGANLPRANLSGADLFRANLSGANLGDYERGPDGYARKKEED